MDLQQLIKLVGKKGFSYVCAILVLIFAITSFKDRNETTQMLSDYLDKSIKKEAFIGFQLTDINKKLEKLDFRMEENNRDIREVKTKMEFIDRK